MINDLLGSATYEEFINALHDDPQWAWSGPFWTRSSVIAEDDYGHRWPVMKWHADKPTPRAMKRLGCSGTHTTEGNLVWLAWDFDVAHGNPKDNYATKEEALGAALRLRQAPGTSPGSGSATALQRVCP